MQRLLIFGMVAASIVVAFAFGIVFMVPGWYGMLLFETCLIFGAVGLIAGFTSGVLARSGPQVIVVTRPSPSRHLRQDNPVDASNDSPRQSAFITRAGAAKSASEA